MEFRRPRHYQSSKPNGIIVLCKKHPKHQQSPGVCAICLTEKLSKLPTTSSSSNCSSSSPSSLSSMSSSRYTSSPSSPVHHHRHHRMASDGRGLSMNFFKSGKNVLTKSRSVAFITRKREGAGEAAASSMDHGKKKTSFWSKLLRPKSKMIDHEGLFHSRIMTRVH